MDRFRGFASRAFNLVAATALLAPAGALAQPGQRVVYNPVTRQTEIEQRHAAPAPAFAQPRGATPSSAGVSPAVHVAMADPVSPANHTAACGCGSPDCGGCELGGVPCGSPVWGDPVCGDAVCGTPCPAPCWYAGFEFTFVKPRYEGNVAFTTTSSDGAGNDVIRESEFDYDLVLTPRVYAGWKQPEGVGLRATWWHFDNEADTATANPPTNGFGQIDHPDFGAVDIGSNVPGDRFSASTALDAYTIDLEATKETAFCGWDLEVGGGVRYAFAEQGYRATLVNASGATRGRIDYSHSIEGIGPTISLGVSRPITPRVSLFSKARGSVLFGDGESTLLAGEDLDITNPFSTDVATGRDDLLSIGEAQLGFRWQGDGWVGGPRRPFLSFAMEGQVWHGAGTATSEDGSLGFFGFTSEIGFDW